MDETIIQKLERLEKIIIEGNLSKKDFLNIEEAVLYLGVKKSTLYKLLSLNKIIYYSPGGKLTYFKKIDLDTYIFSRKVMSEPELKAKSKTNFNSKFKS